MDRATHAALHDRAVRDRLLITICCLCGNVKSEVAAIPGGPAGVSDGLDEACVPAYIEKYGTRRAS
jgi:hypothetical protein